MSGRLAEVIKQVEALSPDEQRSLLAHLTERQDNGGNASTTVLRWKDLRARPPGLVGEDAQEWVSRSRREDQDCGDQQEGR
jgi:hypothetical protein